MQERGGYTWTHLRSTCKNRENPPHIPSQRVMSRDYHRRDDVGWEISAEAAMRMTSIIGDVWHVSEPKVYR
jgi:hypothetical protein